MTNSHTFGWTVSSFKSEFLGKRSLQKGVKAYWWLEADILAVPNQTAFLEYKIMKVTELAALLEVEMKKNITYFLILHQSMHRN